MKILIVSLTLFFAAACGSPPKVIDENLTIKEIMRKAQDAYSKKYYRRALAYYNAGLERFSTDESIAVSIEYEIAFIYYKKKDYETARKLFSDIILKYSEVKGLPEKYKYLSELKLTHIENNPKKRKKRKDRKQEEEKEVIGEEL